VSVLAERRGKFNAATSSDLSRLEDTLTNAVFGALRYLPGEVGLAAFGRLVGEDLAANIAGFDWKAATVNLWSQVPSVRTASGYVEPDVVISVGDLLMGVEAKCRARFDEYPRAAPAAPLHQLTVQAEALRRSAPSTVRRVVVVALTDAAQPPYDDLLRARSELTELGLADEVAVVWAGWHQVGRMLATLPGLRSNESALRDDVVDYLTWRKVLAVYEPVDVDDWTAVGLARIHRRTVDGLAGGVVLLRSLCGYVEVAGRAGCLVLLSPVGPAGRRVVRPGAVGCSLRWSSAPRPSARASRSAGAGSAVGRSGRAARGW